MPLAHYGSWRSPITADLIVSSTVRLSQPVISGDDVYWLESRPTEGGRSVIVRRRPDGSTVDVNEAPLNSRTRVHEYGGADYLVDADTVYFANFADQRLYVARPGADPEPLTQAAEPGALRYADAVLDRARNRLVCIREDHTEAGAEPVNTIVAIDLISGDERVLVSGHDFFAYPRLSPDGAHLSWIAWDHPNMPWDHTGLCVARLDHHGNAEPVQLIAGDEESIVDPKWSPNGDLYFVSDRSGYWNLYHLPAGELFPEEAAMRSREAPPAMPLGTPVLRLEAEFAKPLWQLGASSYGFERPSRIVCTYGVRGTWRLATIDTATGVLTDLDTPYTDFGSLHVAGGRAVFTAGSPTRRSELAMLDLPTGRLETLKASSDVRLDPGYLSQPETIEFPTTLDGRPTTAFAFYYAPRNQDYDQSPSVAGASSPRRTQDESHDAPVPERPPLLVMSHGGPTAATSPVLSLGVQYWTSRGIAVLDVNYGGSTGYGRDYRRRLDSRWGIVDVDDCVNGARYLVDRGIADLDRLAITGGSAGGFTTLAALAFRDVFKAGASYYGVADLEALATDTHKFESRYLDRLIGPYPERRDLYVERSPIHHAEGLSEPVIFFQGLEDRIVPPNQAETMVEVLRRKRVPVAYFTFEGEQHGFRRAENIKRSLEAELLFYGRIFGFTPADNIEPFPIENL